ncbi:hypothetical protein NPIL_348011 [Nephila pilipes]|uniref:Uncharacterized protein n=1 Tax=Nephila pilipes TaxID=299642 RepID=A0A8X6JHW8_NEPPI|nr:hypothetical protein NPIL_348011 [Nephila pilipes]
MCATYENKILREEMLFTINLIPDTKGLLNKNNIPSNNIAACASDGASLIEDRGFVGYLKQVPKLFQDNNEDFINSTKLIAKVQRLIKGTSLARFVASRDSAMQFFKNDVTPEDIGPFSGHLNELKLDMEKRFEDILKLRVYDWMKNPFVVNIKETERTRQEL